MTTSVTDDRQAFEAWVQSEVARGYVCQIGDESDVMWVTWQAALRSQGKVVSVVDLDRLARKWDAKSVRDYGQKSSHAGELRKLLTENGINYVSGGDLTAIIGEGD